jgi:hypothetical protein
MTIPFNVFFHMIKNGIHKKEKVWNLLFHPRRLHLLLSTNNGTQHSDFRNMEKNFMNSVRIFCGAVSFVLTAYVRS